MEFLSQDRVCTEIFTCNEQMNFRFANATIKEKVQLAVVPLNVPEPGVAVHVMKLVEPIVSILLKIHSILIYFHNFII